MENILVCLELAWAQIMEKTLHAVSRHLGFILKEWEVIGGLIA